MTLTTDKTGLPKRNIGPHGVDLSIPRRHTKSHTGRSHVETVARLKAEVEATIRAERDEQDKRSVNRARASGSSKAGQ
jgi:hypothetical protein